MWLFTYYRIAGFSKSYGGDSRRYTNIRFFDVKIKLNINHAAYQEACVEVGKQQKTPGNLNKY